MQHAATSRHHGEDYPEAQRNEILDLLFKPQCAAKTTSAQRCGKSMKIRHLTERRGESKAISRSQRVYWVYLRQLLVLISRRMGMWRRRYGASLQVLKVEIGGDTQQLTQGASGEGPFRKHGPELIALTSSAQ